MSGLSGYVQLRLEFEADAKVSQTIFLKEHTSKDDEDYSSVFAANLPRDTTLDNIKDIVQACTSTMPRKFVRLGSTYGLICCVDDAARDKLLEWCKKKGKKSSIEFETYGPRGSDAYKIRNRARFPDEETLQESIDTFMEAYDDEEEEARLETARQGQLVDEDGFTLVVSSKRKALADIPAPAPAKRNKSLSKDDFYRFQLRDKRKREVNDLLKKYQEDKAKVEELKRKKHFRPY